MKPEPLPGARFTVSESRRGGATQGHAYDESKARSRLARCAAPLQSYVKSAIAIGAAEAIMVSKWEALDNRPRLCTPGRPRGDRQRGGVLYTWGSPFVARIRSN